MFLLKLLFNLCQILIYSTLFSNSKNENRSNIVNAEAVFSFGIKLKFGTCHLLLTFVEIM